MTEELLPLGITPMIASPGRLPIGPEWSYEVKWDGIRALVTVRPGEARPVMVTTRAGNDVSDSFPELVALGDALDVPAVLDGEVVAFDEGGLPSFHRMQGRSGVRGADALLRAQSNPVVFVVFDVVHLDGHSTRGLPLSLRRELLGRLGLENGTAWRVSSVHTDGAALDEATREAGIEGVVAKRTDSLYAAGVRSAAWVKVKHLTIDEFWIGGWIPGEGRRERTIGALLLGLNEREGFGDGNATNADGSSDGDPVAATSLRFIGRVGTGFTGAELDRLLSLLEPDRIANSPFSNDPGERHAVFVVPRYRCRVEYREWSPNGTLRFPSYKGLT